MYRKTLSFIVALIVLTIIAHTTSYADGLTVSHYSGAVLIPPNQTANSIVFRFVATNVIVNTYAYGYNFRVDGGAWSDPVSVGFPASSSIYGDFGVWLGAGSHTIEVRLLLYEYPPGLWQIRATASTGITLTQQYNVTVQNSYGAGNIIADGSQYASGTTFAWNSGSSHTLSAIDGQSYDGYVRRFNNWSTGAGTSSIGISVSGNGTYTAVFKREFNVGFQNNYPGYGNGGVINVNGTQYSSPTSNFPVREDLTITGGVVNTYQVINGIEYTFNNWSPGGSTSSSTTFTPADHVGYVANFNAKPLPPPGITFVGTTNDPIQLAWSAHPSGGVTQYQIWRIVKPMNENQGAPQLIATIGGGATSYTDYDYTYTAGYTNDLLNYDVRAYFSPSGTYADPNYLSIFGRIGARQVEDGNLVSTAGESPTSYAVSNYPNPFNPSTTISYQLVEEASVTLEIYDVMGRKISSLVQEQKQAGYYTAKWDGRDNSGKQVATGMYLYRFTAAPTSGKQPFTKSGKLLLTK